MSCLPQVYQMSTIKPPESVEIQRFPGVFLFELERYVYQMSTNSTFIFIFLINMVLIVAIFNHFSCVRVVMLCEFGKKVIFFANI